MKWYVLSAIIISGLNCMLAAIILSLALFHLCTDKSTNAPIAPNEDWISLVNGHALFAAVWMFISLVAMWISMMKKRIWLSSVVLSGFLICFGISVYFTVTFCAQLGMEDVKADTLFNVTLNEISQANLKHQSKAWIPEWLDNIQKQSKSCCGIVTYRDYDLFWPDSSSKIPRSCCRDLNNETNACPEDLNKIPFPSTPADFFKVEIGCMEEINQATKHHVRESYENSFMVNVFIALATGIYLLLFVKRYLVGVAESEIGKWASCSGANKTEGGDGDLEGCRGDDSACVARQAFNIASSSELMKVIDSVEGVLSPGSIDSITFPVDQKIQIVARPHVVVDAQESIKPDYEKEMPLQLRLPARSQPSATKINKANAALAGIVNKKNQQTEVAAGDDNMTVGAGNMGRQEVFIAQDGMDGRTKLGDSRNLQGSTSFDDVGDIIVPDQETGSPPGSPNTKRRRKERKLGMSRHRRHQ